jgi:hypothetical protein
MPWRPGENRSRSIFPAKPDRGAGVAEFHRDRDLVQVRGDGAEFGVVIVAVHTQVGRFSRPGCAHRPETIAVPAFPDHLDRPAHPAGATGSAALI